MQAIIITQSGSPGVLQLQERPTPKPKPCEVLVQVKAAGINRPDIAQRKGHYPPPPQAPQDIPGLEISGVVVECGDAVTRWNAGDEICALLPGGGYAEFAVVLADHCLPKPTAFSFAEAASLPETIFTVWHNVFQRGKLKANENFLVHGGSSGIGITAIQLAKAFGATVFATAGTDAKCLACIKLGAEGCINYNNQEFEMVLANKGIDVILDMIGGDYFAKNIHLLNADGRLVYINAMKGADVNLNIMDIMRRRLTITGSTLRNREDVFKAELAKEIEEKVWPLINEGKFKPVIYKTFPLSAAADAHSLMESSEHIGKIILTVEE